MKKKLWHISKRVTVWLYRFFEAFVAFVFVILSLAFWKLYTEPLDAKFMLPTLSKELLPKDSKYTLDVQSAQLSAEFEAGGLFHLNMRGLQLLRADKTVAINLPNVSLSYGLLHILTLNYMPDQLRIEKPDIHIVIDQDGNWRLQAKNEPESVKMKKRGMPSAKRIFNHILSFDSIVLSDAKLMVDDLAQGENLSIPKLNLYLKKRYGFRHVARVNAVAQMADHLTDIKARAEYSRLTKNLTVEAGITPIYVSHYGRFWSLLEGIDVPVSVSMVADFNMKRISKGIVDAVQKLKFQIKALKSGTVTLPSPIHATYPLVSAEINGAATAGLKTIKIAKSKAALKGKIAADLNVEVTGIDRFLKKHRVSDIQTTLNAVVKNVQMADVPKVWPKEQGTDAHEWVEQHLSKGYVSAADFKLVFKGDVLEDVFGLVRVQDVKVDYLPDMPPLEKVVGEVLLYPNEVKINANAGYARNVQLMDAKLVFAPLDADITDLAISLDLEGPISEMLSAINQRPLSLLEDADADFDWEHIQGNAQTKVQLNFPLDEDILTEKLQVSVRATSQNASAQVTQKPFWVNYGDLKLFVNNQGLTLSGQASFKAQPIQILWHEDFTPPKKTSSTYQAQGVIAAETLKDLIPDIKKYATGDISFSADLKQLAPKRLLEGEIVLDFDQAQVPIYPLAVQKQKNEEAQLMLSLKNVAPDLMTGVCDFDLKGMAQKKDMLVKGQVVWGDDWKIALNEVKAANNDFQGVVEKKEDTLTLNIKGKSWNLSQLKNLPLFDKETEYTEEMKTIWPTNILLEAQLAQLVLNPKNPIKNVLINAERKSNFWKYFQVEAQIKDPFVLVYNPEQRVFHGEYGDLGLLLSSLGLSEKFSGGQLRLQSKQDETGKISGQISVDQTELTEPGFLLQASSILGIVDAIRGKNLEFDEIQVPFELMPEGELTLDDGYAAGSNWGVTFRGVVNLDQIAIAGSVIPAYLVNSLPGKIPLIGALFREGEGGGLISVKYSVKGRLGNPQVEFHPLSSMAPGALGYIF